jgi:CRISPR-associated protein (TIGR02584 family)
MSPAVLTETVWALAHEPEPVLPTRVIVVTTSEGRRVVETQLFQPDPRLSGRCPWDALREALRAQGFDLTNRLRFGVTGDDIRIMTAVDSGDGRSRELADLRTVSDNEAAADFLLEQVRTVVENPDLRLVASLAGGRKTMGALLYACMTLAGRETDRLTHVLVNDPFDTLRGFWFPGQGGGPLQDRHQREFDPSTAHIELADVPFVPLRNLFQRELGRKAGSFHRLVDDCREEVRRAAGERIRLTLDRSRCELEVSGTRLTSAPREHLILLFLATRAKSSEPAFATQKEALDPLNAFRRELIDSAPGDDFADWRHGEGLGAALDELDLRRALSGLRDRLRKAGGNAVDLVGCLPGKGRFSLSVPGSMIHLK